MAHGFATAAVDHPPRTREATIGARFCGPPNSGNGGYAVGLVAKHLRGAVEVTLKRPLPLDNVMQIAIDTTTAGVFHEGHELASARETTLALEVPKAISFREAAEARAGFSGYQVHPFPNCFVCGTHRLCGDGMCLFTGDIGEGIVASSWVPNEEFANEDGVVAAEFLGAALDCPGAWSLIGKYDIRGPVVLGRMTYEAYRPVHCGGRYVVMGWPIGKEGRKSFCGTAIFDAEGALCAAAKATWIELKR